MQPEYSSTFYDFMSSSQAKNAKKALEALATLYRPSSVVDVGCGIGGWTATAGALFDIKPDNLLGLDGRYVDRSKLVIPERSFMSADLELPLSFTKRFDLAICCEVAEHLTIERAPSFIRDLVEASDVILFSAAAPFQGGTHHINEQWPEFWAILFRYHGYVAYDAIRDKIWLDEEIAWYYRQNLLIFAKPEIGDKLFGADRAVRDKPLTRIHPYMFLTMMTKCWPNMYGEAFGCECRHWQLMTEAYVSGAVVPPETPVVPNAMVSEWGEFRREHIEQMHSEAPTNPRIFMENPVTVRGDTIQRYTGGDR